MSANNPGSLQVSILHQSEYWIDRRGVKHRLEEMTGTYLISVRDYLRRNAARLIDMELALIDVEVATEGGPRFFQSLKGKLCSPKTEKPIGPGKSPEEWVEQTMLFRRIQSMLGEEDQQEEPEADSELSERIDQVMEEILTELGQRGDRVYEWPDDEAAAYRDNNGFQPGRDAVNKIRAAKAAARIKEVIGL